MGGRLVPWIPRPKLIPEWDGMYGESGDAHFCFILILTNFKISHNLMSCPGLVSGRSKSMRHIVIFLVNVSLVRAPGGVNNNVRIPNQKRAIYQVVVQYRRMMGRSNGRIRRRGMYWNSFTMTILGRVGG